MGAAHVIPGVSGGTMALLTGIFERLIHAIKAFDGTAIRLLLCFRLKELAAHINLPFISAIGIGVLASLLTFARILEVLFERHAMYVWSFFFGLVLASVYFIGRTIRTRSLPAVALFLFGAVVAASMAFLSPASENASVPYLFVCGTVAMCSMILPGLSGSYALLLMGNYELVMIQSIARFNLAVLIPVGMGAVAGAALFARLFSWILKRFHDQTIALLTGFVFGSLGILWPWKTPVIRTFQKGSELKEKVIGYEYTLPEPDAGTFGALLVMLAGITVIALTEIASRRRTSPI